MEHDKLIIFAWITTILGMPEDADPTKYNELTDKIHEIMQFREKQAPGEIIDEKGPIVLLRDKHASQSLSEAHRA